MPAYEAAQFGSKSLEKLEEVVLGEAYQPGLPSREVNQSG
jgi:hypothetical protein